ncbi:low-density lipoprotein receptor-related protein 6-like isoform X2 [Ptychodera flava]|uniref:low-density lipoprotein receptor-related protein 6-like isoform X2 n=1 Tax=Ptychodera flava TaxID=63121 RepID=UPI003969ED9F
MKLSVLLFIQTVLIFCGLCEVKTQNDNPGVITGPRLIWVDRNSFGISSRIVNKEGNGTTLWNQVDKSSVTMVSRLLQEQVPSSKVAIDYDYDDHFIFWTDPGYKMVKKAMLAKKGNITGVFHGTSNYVEGIAVDWLNNKIYWTDAAYNWIMVSDYEGTYYHCVVSHDLDKPRGIALNPLTGHLYWSDWGKNSKIEMATLSGKNRVVLVSEAYHGAVIGLPNGLTIDYEENYLYWADSSNDNLYSINLEGANGLIQKNKIRVVGSTELFGHFFDLDLDKDFFFISDWGNSAIDIVPRNNLTQTRYLRPSGMFKPYGVVMYDQVQQPTPENEVACATDNGGCDQLCVGDPEGHRCMCSIGYVLAEDGRTCKNQTSHIAQMQLFFADTDGICQLPANVADIAITDSQPYNCFLNASVATFDYDAYDEKLFFFDKRDSYIKTFSLEEGGDPVKLILAGNVTGIAVDWLSNNIFWTDIAEKHISVAKLNGDYQFVVLEGDSIDKPMAVVTYPKKGVLYWAESGANPRIERIDMSGRNPDVLVQANIIQPVALTIDFANDKLYWSDIGTGTVESISLTGEGRRPLLNSQTDHLYRGITSYQDFFYVAERNNEWIVILNKEEKKHTRSLGVDGLDALKFYDKSLQPTDTGVCDLDNGGCSQLCLPTPHGAECVCQAEGNRVSQQCDSVLRCPTSFVHGRVVDDCENTAGKSCKFVCNEYFKPNTDQLLKCQRDGFWSNETDLDKLCALDSTLDHFLLVADTGQIVLIDFIQDGTYKFIPLPIPEVVNPVAIDFDFVENKLYWTDANQRRIHRANIDGSGKEIIADNVEVPDGLALDIVNRHVYWTDAGSPQKIERANLNGTGRQTVISSGLDKPRAIMIDTADRRMYWTDWSPNGASINRAKLDGSGREKIAQGELSWPNGLVIDQKDKKLYWCDAHMDKIEMSNLNGTDRRQLLDLGDKSHPFGLTLEGKTLYWTDWNAKHISTAEKLTGQNGQSIGEGRFKKPNDIHVYHRNYSTIATPLPTKEPEPTEKPTQGKATESASSKGTAKPYNATVQPHISVQNSSVSSVLLPLLIVLLLAIVAVIVVIYMRKKRRTPSLPARMKFDRPVYKNLTEETDSVLAYYRDDEAELASTQPNNTQQSNGTATPQLGQYSRLQFDNGNEYVTFSQ